MNNLSEKGGLERLTFFRDTKFNYCFVAVTLAMKIPSMHLPILLLRKKIIFNVKKIKFKLVWIEIETFTVESCNLDYEYFYVYSKDRSWLVVQILNS